MIMKKYFLVYLLPFFLVACKNKNEKKPGTTMSVAQYFNYGDNGVQSAGIKMIPVKTPVGEFKVWTKRFGNNPRIKILLLHGGPAMTHEYMEMF